MKTVSIFNHKGGVGKTTLTYNLGCRLAAKKKRVLLVDADPQCNLTSLALTEAAVDNLYSTNEYTLAQALHPLIPGTGDISVQDPHSVDEFGVSLLAGDLLLSKFEDVLAREWNGLYKPEERAARLVSAMSRLFAAIGQKLQLDLVLLDLGPSIGPLNQAAILSSDFFLVPTTPDIYSVRAIQSVSSTVRRWIDDYAGARQRLKKTGFPFQMPDGEPKFLGYAAQKFGIYRQEPAQSFQTWIDRIESEVQNVLVQSLTSADPGPMIIDKARTHPRLAELQNYHSLVPASQEAHRPIWALRGNTDINAGHMDKVRECGLDFDKVATEFIKRTGV